MSRKDKKAEAEYHREYIKSHLDAINLYQINYYHEHPKRQNAVKQYGKIRWAKLKQHRLIYDILYKERPDYTNFWYCGKCYRNIPKDSSPCPLCKKFRFIRKRRKAHAKQELPRY